MITKNTITFFKNSLLGFLLLTLFNLSAQQKQLISGNIMDINNIPIPGVNILEESNPRNGTVSDFDGNFAISITPNSTLTFSYVGYETQSVKITTETTLKIILQEDLSSLDEITIVAYGKQKNRVSLQQ